MTEVQTGALTVPSESYIAALVHGFTWSGGVREQAALTYYMGSTSAEGTQPLTQGQEDALREALNEISLVANITFVEAGSASQADIMIGQEDLRHGVLGVTHTWYTGTLITHSEVTITSTPIEAFGDHIQTAVFIHEILHALGLKHPGNYGGGEEGPFLTGADDSWDHSVMSYNAGYYAGSISEVTTPMIYDIATLQYLYGANPNANQGNTTFAMIGANNVQTIWDSGGVDTIATNSFTGNAVVDLNEGPDNRSVAGIQALWIAYGAHIENAATGSGNDTIMGNALANQLTSGEGQDIIFGWNANDTLSGQGGWDFLQGNQGSDALFGGDGGDTMFGGKDTDTLLGENGDDILGGNIGSDTLYGGGGQDSLRGGKDDDVLCGNAGNDTLMGDAGNDQLQGSEGSDLFAFYAGSGQDTILDFEGVGSALGDLLGISGALFSNVSAVLQVMSYGGNQVIIPLNNDDSITLIGVASGLTSQDIIIL